MMFDLKSLIRPNVLQMHAYASARDEFKGNSGIFLDANENPFGTLNRYPDPMQSELKKQLSLLKNISENQIFIGNGSDEIIDLTFRIFCNPGKDKALTFTPTYGMYRVCADLNDVELEELPLDEAFNINFDSYLNCAQSNTFKLLLLCSPNNPTGNVIGNVIEIASVFPGIVIVDEAYIDFSNTESMITKLSRLPNVIVLQTLSKAWGLAGARIGMAFASSEIISVFNKVKPPYNVSLPNQLAALYRLKNIDAFTQRRDLLIREREKLAKALEDFSFVVQIYPSEANFILVKTTDANAIYNQLIDSGIIVRNRNSAIAGCLRISVGTPDENTKLIAQLKQIKL